MSNDYDIKSKILIPTAFEPERTEEEERRDSLIQEATKLLDLIAHRAAAKGMEPASWPQIGSLAELVLKLADAHRFIAGATAAPPEQDISVAFLGTDRCRIAIRSRPTADGSGRTAEIMEHCPECGKGLAVSVAVLDRQPPVFTAPPDCDKCAPPTACPDCNGAGQTFGCLTCGKIYGQSPD